MGRGCKLFHRNPDRDPRKNITLNTFHRFLIPRRITARLIRVKKKLIRRKKSLLRLSRKRNSVNPLVLIVTTRIIIYFFFFFLRRIYFRPSWFLLQFYTPVHTNFIPLCVPFSSHSRLHTCSKEEKRRKKNRKEESRFFRSVREEE